MAIPLAAPTRRQFTLGLAGAALAFSGTRNSVYNPLLAAHTSFWRAEMAARNKQPADMLDEVLTVTRRAGYLRVQLIDEFLASGLLERAVARAGRLGLELSVACAGGPMHTREAAEATRAATLAKAERLVGNAVCLGFTASPRPDGAPKTDDDLRTQARQLNLLGQDLARAGLDLLIEHEDAGMRGDAREWRHMLANVEAQFAGFCLDLDCAVRAGANPWTLIEAAGGRLRSLHLRNVSHGRAQAILRDGDIDMGHIAAQLRAMQFDGFLVVELARDDDARTDHPLANALAQSRSYVQMLFGSPAGSPRVKRGPHVRFPR